MSWLRFLQGLSRRLAKANRPHGARQRKPSYRLTLETLETRTVPSVTAPTSLAISPDTGSSATDAITDTASITLSGTITADDAQVEVFDGSTDLGPATIDANANTFSMSLNNLSAGQHALQAVAQDSTGATASTTLNVVIDVTAPTTTASAGANAAGWNNGPATVTLTATDPNLADGSAGSGVAGTFYTVDGGSVQTYTGGFVVSGEGAHTVTYYSTDVAGNQETPQTLTVNIDQTPPTLQVPFSPVVLTANALGGANLTPDMLSVSASDNLSGLASVTTTPSFVPLGTTTVQVTATDNAGNQTIDTVTVTVNPGPAQQFAFVTGPQTLTAGVASNTITVQLEDAFGNAVQVASRGGQVVQLRSDSHTGRFKNAADRHTIATVKIPFGSTEASFLYVDTKVGTPTLTARFPRLTAATQQETITPAAAARLVFGQQPTTTEAGQVISPAVTVELLDRFNNLTTSTDSVTLALAHHGRNSASLAGTTTEAAVNGIATFADLTVSSAGGANRLTAGADGLKSVNSHPFTVTAGEQLTLSAPRHVRAGQPFALTVTAMTASGVDTAFQDTVNFLIDGNPSASLPSYPFTGTDQGTHTFLGLTLPSGSHTITVTDASNGNIVGQLTISVK